MRGMCSVSRSKSITLTSAFLPTSSDAAVAEAEERGGVGGLLLDHVLERQLSGRGAGRAPSA